MYAKYIQNKKHTMIYISIVTNILWSVVCIKYANKVNREIYKCNLMNTLASLWKPNFFCEIKSESGRNRVLISNLCNS